MLNEQTRQMVNYETMLKINAFHNIIDYLEIDSYYESYFIPNVDKASFADIDNAQRLLTSSQADKRDTLSEFFQQLFTTRVMILENRLFVRTNNQYVFIAEYQDERFGTFLKYITESRNVKPFSMGKYLNEEQYVTIAKSLSKRLTIKRSFNHIMQFNDAYLDQSGLHEGVADKLFPSHHFNRDVLNLYHTRKLTCHVPEVDDLIMHIANNDVATANRLWDDLSLSLVSDIAIKSQHQRFIRVYGPTAANGKSTLSRLIQRAFAVPDTLKELMIDNVKTFNAAEITGFNLGNILRALIAIEEDAREIYWNDDVSATIKQIITCDTIPYRDIYQAPAQIRASVMLISFSNFMPKISDKTQAFDRRIDWFETKDKLFRNDEWFDVIRSDQASQYLFEKCFIRSLELSENPELMSPVSKEMIKTQKFFKEMNINVFAFLNELTNNDISNIDLALVRGTYTAYELWCNENKETAFAFRKFKEIVKSLFPVDIKRMRLSYCKDFNPSKMKPTNQADLFVYLGKR